MMSSKRRIFITVTTAISLMAVGCAKKQKPDMEISGIEPRDMTFEASGSDSGKISGLFSVHFDYDKSSLSSEDRNLLAKDAQWLKDHNTMSLQVEGHCDRHGSIEYNMGLGQKRADAVKLYLVNLGIEKDRLTTISYGKEQLLDPAESDAADAKNRRANFHPISSPKINRLSVL